MGREGPRQPSQDRGIARDGRRGVQEMRIERLQRVSGLMRQHTGLPPAAAAVGGVIAGQIAGIGISGGVKS